MDIPCRDKAAVSEKFIKTALARLCPTLNSADKSLFDGVCELLKYNRLFLAEDETQKLYLVREKDQMGREISVFELLSLCRRWNTAGMANASGYSLMRADEREEELAILQEFADKEEKTRRIAVDRIGNAFSAENQSNTGLQQKTVVASLIPFPYVDRPTSEVDALDEMDAQFQIG